jgi:hypothetical protein
MILTSKNCNITLTIPREADMHLRQRTEILACTVGVDGEALKKIHVASGHRLDVLAAKYGLIRCPVVDVLLWGPATLDSFNSVAAMAEPTDAERRAELLRVSQANCEKHRRERKPFDTFIGSHPPTCAFCGITKAQYEKDSPA